MENQTIEVKKEKKQLQDIVPVSTTRSMLPVGDEATTIARWAEAVAQAPFYQKMGGVPAIISIWLAARELGIPEMQALNGGMWNVQGRVILSAPMMNQLIWKAGHKIEKVTHTNEICHLRGIRRDGSRWEEVATIQEAQKAGLTTKDVWKNYPKKMLFHTAMRDLARNFFPDVLGGCDVGDKDILETEGEILPTLEPEKPQMSEEEKAFLNALTDEQLEYVSEIASKTKKAKEEILHHAFKDQAKFYESFELYKAKNAG